MNEQTYTVSFAHGSAFRTFCIEKWFEHKDEILSWTGQPLTEYDSNYYFRKHRWMLKQMYKDQRRTHVRSISE